MFVRTFRLFCNKRKGKQQRAIQRRSMRRKSYFLLRGDALSGGMPTLLPKLRESCEAAQLQQENSALREEIKELKAEKRIGPKIELADGVYWRLEGKERVGPFCPSCYHEYRQFVGLLDGSRYVAQTRWICTACNRVFGSRQRKGGPRLKSRRQASNPFFSKRSKQSATQKTAPAFAQERFVCSIQPTISNG